jgi:hypothetical protein
MEYFILMVEVVANKIGNYLMDGQLCWQGALRTCLQLKKVIKKDLTRGVG